MSRINCPDGATGALLGSTSPYTTDTDINYGTEDVVIFNPSSNLNSIINTSSSVNMKAGRTFIVNNIGTSTVTLKAYNSGGSAITLAVLNNGIAYVTILTTNPQVAADFQIVVGSNGIISKNDDYVILNNDGVSTILATVVNKTYTLPPTASNVGRIITVKKSISGNGIITIAAQGSELINGSASVVLDFYKETITIQSNGTGWDIIQWDIPEITYALTASGPTGWSSTANGCYGNVTKNRSGNWYLEFHIQGSFSSAASGTIAVSNITFKNITGVYYPFVCSFGSGFWSSYGVANEGNVYFSLSTNGTSITITGKAPLETKPSFVI